MVSIIKKVTLVAAIFFLLFFSYQLYLEDYQPVAEKELEYQQIIYYTNQQRKQLNLPSLRENVLLNQAAEMKAEDILNHQYFAHVSPSGAEASDLVNYVGYKYIFVAENLILGNYNSEEDMVQAWMDSPGHRENIVNDQIKDIGVSLIKGEYEGSTVWVGVQIFGRPENDCFPPSATIKQEIDNANSRISFLKQQIDSLNLNNPKNIQQHNNYVNEYNELIDRIESLTSNYNQQVQSYNQCINE